jgi:uncharacterized protein involved in exopolysaccharide biosynthesis
MSIALETRAEEDDLIDLRLLLARVMARRWWVAAAFVLFTGAFAAYAFLATPIYRASTILVPANENRAAGGLGAALGGLGGLASLAGLDLNSSGLETEEALAVLKSRQFTEDFIRQEGLMPKLFHSEWDAARKTWTSRKPPTLAKGFKYFDKKVRSVSSDKKTGLITLQIDWRDREEAAAWANELVSRLNAEMRSRAIVKANAAVGYLEKESNTTSTIATREAIGRLIEAQVKQRMLANVTHEYALRVVDHALPADKDDPVRPKKVVLIALGAILGIVVGVLAALLFYPPGAGTWKASAMHGGQG